jgi:alkylation response protein AidB-like acyl-CoA dehydrogenase
VSVEVAAGAHEVAAFAEAVATAADRTLTPPDAWRPGAAQDDRSPALSDALAAMGWLDLAADPALLPLAGPAALELGRRLAPLADIDALLGGSPLAGGLIRYGARHAIDGNGMRHAIEASEPVAYGDALGVHRVVKASPAGEVSATAVAAWTAAGTGYLAGVADWALGLALDHAKGRRAFGTTLAGLAPVQQRLADAATATRGLALLAGDTPGRAALAHAGAAAVEVTAACQQVAGAIGFTLEFPLQRAYRRARAVQLWADALLTRPSR